MNVTLFPNEFKVMLILQFNFSFRGKRETKKNVKKMTLIVNCYIVI